MLIGMHPEPVFRVTRGTPTAEELAALVGVLLSAGPAAPAAPAPPSRWRASTLPAHRGVRAGAGAWRASALPR
jgi:hypothetical protein